MKRDELKRLIQGPIATVPTAFDDAYHVDFEAMAECARWWVANGLVAGRSVIKVAAAMGQGPDLTDDEWPHLLRTVVRASEGKAAIVCGLKPKDTWHTVEDAKRAQDLGAIGVQIELPLFHVRPTQDDLVRFYSDISEHVGIGIVIYNTWHFAGTSISSDSILRLADAEHVVAVKWFVPASQDYDEMRLFANALNVIDNSLQPIRCHRNGGRGFINNTMHAYPAHDLEVWRLLEERRYAEAQELWDSVNAPLRAFIDKCAQRSGGYRVGRELMTIQGHRMGPPRLPTLPLVAEELAELRELMAGFGWSSRAPGGVDVSPGRASTFAAART